MWDSGASMAHARRAGVEKIPLKAYWSYIFLYLMAYGFRGGAVCSWRYHWDLLNPPVDKQKKPDDLGDKLYRSNHKYFNEFWLLVNGILLAGMCIQPGWRKIGEPWYFLAIFRKMRAELLISSRSPGSSRVKSCWSQTKFRKLHFWIKHVSLAQKQAALFLLWISLQDMLTFLRNKPGITRLALGAMLWLWGSNSLPCMNSFYVAIGQSYSIQWKMAF